MKVGVILNPIAGGGGLLRARAELEAALTKHFESWDIRLTGDAGDGEHLAMAFAADGCDVVIAAGGDGTANEAADGLLQTQTEHGAAPALAFLPCGTGTDFARGLGLTRDIGATIKRIAEAAPRQVDAGRICYVDDQGRLASRHFLNIASAGLSGATARSVNQDKRKGRVSAKALFFWRTVAEFLRYRFENARVTIDDAEPIEAKVALVAVCNGRFFGAGMMIAPDAELSDGLFDVVIVRASGKLGLIRDLRLLYGGLHRNHPAITILRGKRITVEPMDDAAKAGGLIEIDGEPPGRIPATFEVLPGALTLKC
ncbi:MAG: diacylglycerol kinase family protein [Rhizobiaceae bacterium]